MSERRIIIVIVLALFAGAWYFGYDSGGGNSGGSTPNGGSPSAAAPLIRAGSPTPPAGPIARYPPHAFTPAIVRATDATAAAPTPAATPKPRRDLEYTISPLVGENDNGMPIRLYIDGQVLEYQK